MLRQGFAILYALLAIVSFVGCKEKEGPGSDSQVKDQAAIPTSYAGVMAYKSPKSSDTLQFSYTLTIDPATLSGVWNTDVLEESNPTLAATVKATNDVNLPVTIEQTRCGIGACYNVFGNDPAKAFKLVLIVENSKVTSIQYGGATMILVSGNANNSNNQVVNGQMFARVIANDNLGDPGNPFKIVVGEGRNLYFRELTSLADKIVAARDENGKKWMSYMYMGQKLTDPAFADVDFVQMTRFQDRQNDLSPPLVHNIKAEVDAFAAVLNRYFHTNSGMSPIGAATSTGTTKTCFCTVTCRDGEEQSPTLNVPQTASCATQMIGLDMQQRLCGANNTGSATCR